MKHIFYGPPDWLRGTNARLRAAIAFWMLILTMPILAIGVVFFPTALWLASGMLVFNTGLSIYALVAAETPVEGES